MKLLLIGGLLFLTALAAYILCKDQLKLRADALVPETPAGFGYGDSHIGCQ